MKALRPVIMAVAAGLLVYFSANHFLSAKNEVTRGDTRGVIQGDTTPVTSVSPLVSSVSPRLSPHVSPATPTPPLSPHEPSHVVINEIAWMGTATTSNDEWLELYNAGPGAADLAGWHLTSDDGKPAIMLSGILGPGAYYLIERTSDATVPGVTADLVTSFGTGLGDKGENLKLFDRSGRLQDQVDCAAGWYAGAKISRKTMERIDPTGPGNDRANWGTSNSPILGTPRSKNSVSR